MIAATYDATSAKDLERLRRLMRPKFFFFHDAATVEVIEVFAREPKHLDALMQAIEGGCAEDDFVLDGVVCPAKAVGDDAYEGLPRVLRDAPARQRRAWSAGFSSLEEGCSANDEDAHR